VPARFRREPPRRREDPSRARKRRTCGAIVRSTEAPVAVARNDEQGKVLTRTETRTKLSRPRLYRVLLHNDDYTPRDFVVLVLVHVFHMGEADATHLMLHVHNHGVGVIGLYPYSVAETKVAEALAISEKAKFPLLCTMEPADDGDEGDGA
jgi:ATP-dependent Clp protease adaptor protein ClpS